MVRSTRRGGIGRAKCLTGEGATSDEDGMLGSNEFDNYLQFILREISEERHQWFEYVDSLWFYLFHNGKDQRVLQWCKKLNLYSKKYTCVPIVMWSHWRLIILCNFNEDIGNDSHCILVLDSLQSMEQRLEIEIRKFVLETMTVKGRTISMNDLKKIPILMPKVPQQINSVDCGYYCLYYAKEFMRNAPENFEIYDYPYFKEVQDYTEKVFEAQFGDYLDKVTRLEERLEVIVRDFNVLRDSSMKSKVSVTEEKMTEASECPKLNDVQP